MLSKLNTYLNFNGIKRFKSFLMGRSHFNSASGHCCLGIAPQNVAIAYASNHTPTQLQFLDAMQYRKSDNLSLIMSKIVKTRNIEGTPCTWVLRPENYQLLLLDELPVADAEFQAAIRWKIKGMLSFPIEDAVIESFSVPLQKTHDPRPMIMVVAARISYLQEHVEKIQDSGLNLTSIEIPELTLRNVTALYENDEKSTALIYMRENASQLIITCQKLLYFQRNFDVGLEAIQQLTQIDIEKDSNPQLDALALELQRSFDFYQSQWRQAPPARIFLAARESSSTLIANYLAQRLVMQIQPFDIREMLLSKQDLTTELQGRYLPVIGGILRTESVEHATTN